MPQFVVWLLDVSVNNFSINDERGRADHALTVFELSFCSQKVILSY